MTEPAAERLAALVLAAGRGSRLRPMTDTTPKPLLKVGGRTLLDLALDRVATVLPVNPGHVAVNAHWLAEQVAAHLGHGVHLSLEAPVALGTAGAVGQLHDWLGDRDLLITNGDAWYDPPPDLVSFVDAWDRQRPRLLVVKDDEQPDFEGRWRFAGTSLLPAGVAQSLPPVEAGLYEAVWSRMPVDLVPTEVRFIDCGTPEDLELARQLAADQPGLSEPEASAARRAARPRSP